MSITTLHTHIDSSGVFVCPLGSACKLPDTGQVFDAMLQALKDTRAVLEDLRAAGLPTLPDEIDRLTRAIALAEGKPC